jgi:enoyl-CoA hydratase
MNAPWNQMGQDYMDALELAVTQAAANPAVRALVFTAEGEQNFSVGMDLREVAKLMQRPAHLEVMLAQRQRVLDMIESMGKPSIATLFGHCLGGGLELPLACHFRLAADTGARIGLPELELGVIPAWGGTVRLTRCIGMARTLDLILRARKIDGEEALRIGLVQSLHPVGVLKDAAHALALELAAMPRQAVAAAMQCVAAVGDLSQSEALALERRHVLACAGSVAQLEGFAAFAEKRRPNFLAQIVTK